MEDIQNVKRPDAELEWNLESAELAYGVIARYVERGQRILAELHCEQTLDRRRQTGRRTADGADRADARRIEGIGVTGYGELRSNNRRRVESQARRRREVPPDRRARDVGIQDGEDRRLGVETSRADRELG